MFLAADCSVVGAVVCKPVSVEESPLHVHGLTRDALPRRVDVPLLFCAAEEEEEESPEPWPV